MRADLAVESNLRVWIDGVERRNGSPELNETGADRTPTGCTLYNVPKGKHKIAFGDVTP